MRTCILERVASSYQSNPSFKFLTFISPTTLSVRYAVRWVNFSSSRTQLILEKYKGVAWLKKGSRIIYVSGKMVNNTAMEHAFPENLMGAAKKEDCRKEKYLYMKEDFEKVKSTGMEEWYSLPV